MSDRTIEILNRQVGKALAERRRKVLKRQQDVADECGISRSSLANIEKGRQAVSLGLLYKLSETLEVADARKLLPSRLPLEVKHADPSHTEAEVQSTEEVSELELQSVNQALAAGVRGVQS